MGLCRLVIGRGTKNAKIQGAAASISIDVFILDNIPRIKPAAIRMHIPRRIIQLCICGRIFQYQKIGCKQGNESRVSYKSKSRIPDLIISPLFYIPPDPKNRLDMSSSLKLLRMPRKISSGSVAVRKISECRAEHSSHDEQLFIERSPILGMLR
jgi:hypothetical protein